MGEKTASKIVPSWFLCPGPEAAGTGRLKGVGQHRAHYKRQRYQPRAVFPTGWRAALAQSSGSPQGPELGKGAGNFRLF